MHVEANEPVGISGLLHTRQYLCHGKSANRNWVSVSTLLGFSYICRSPFMVPNGLRLFETTRSQGSKDGIQKDSTGFRKQPKRQPGTSWWQCGIRLLAACRKQLDIFRWSHDLKRPICVSPESWMLSPSKASPRLRSTTSLTSNGSKADRETPRSSGQPLPNNPGRIFTIHLAASSEWSKVSRTLCVRCCITKPANSTRAAQRHQPEM